MHHVALALYPGFQALNLAVSTVLEFANRSLRQPLYQVHLLSEHGGPVLSSGGFAVSTEPFGRRRFDTVLVVGDNDTLPTPPALVAFLQRAARRVAAHWRDLHRSLQSRRSRASRWPAGHHALVLRGAAAAALSACAGGGGPDLHH